MILLIGHTKGGVGKSTLAVNLAVAYQQRGYTVNIIEADPTITTSSQWANTREASGLDPIVTVRKDGLLGAALREASAHYDIVIVDAAGKDSEALRSAMGHAEVMLIPARPTQADMDATYDLMGIVRTAKDLNPALLPVVVLTQVGTQVFSHEKEEAREYLQDIEADAYVLSTVIHTRRAYQNALPAGCGVTESEDPKARAEITHLATEILTLTEGDNLSCQP